LAESLLPKSFKEALLSLTRWFEAEHVPYTSIGGLAVSLLAHPRVTQDIDVLVWVGEEEWVSFLRAGEGYGFEERISGALEFAKQSRVFLLRHKPGGVSIDVTCGALPFEREMIDRALTLRVGDLSVKVPTPEDLIIMKWLAQRPKDLRDIENILSTNEGLDIARVRRWVREFAAALEMPGLLSDLERLLQR
jgi:hypothetical protein